MNRIATKLAALAILLAGGSAFADDIYARHVREMNKGKDYIAAWEAVSRDIGTVDSPQLVREAMKREAALAASKDYAASWEASRAAARFAPEAIAKAQRQLAALNQGKDYVDAWTVAREPEPIARAPRTGGPIARK